MKKDTKKLRYVIVRADKAGVFAGELAKLEGTHATLLNARRLWRWGGASLSQVATTGPVEPQNTSRNKFPRVIPRVELLHAFEIADVTPQAQAAIESVPIWEV